MVASKLARLWARTPVFTHQLQPCCWDLFLVSRGACPRPENALGQWRKGAASKPRQVPWSTTLRQPVTLGARDLLS